MYYTIKCTIKTILTYYFLVLHSLYMYVATCMVHHVLYHPSSFTCTHNIYMYVTCMHIIYAYVDYCGSIRLYFLFGLADDGRKPGMTDPRSTTSLTFRSLKSLKSQHQRERLSNRIRHHQTGMPNITKESAAIVSKGDTIKGVKTNIAAKIQKIIGFDNHTLKGRASSGSFHRSTSTPMIVAK